MVKTVRKISSGKKKRTILLVDDHVLFRAGLTKVFDQTEYASSIFFEAGDGKEAVDIALREEVDLIFLDESMPELSGFDAAGRILASKPESKIIALTQFDEMPLIMNYFKLGVKGFSSKAIDAAQITEAARTVLDGNYYYHSKFDNQIRSWLSTGLRKGLPAIRFTEREVEVLIHLSKGRTNHEIAGILGISSRTVETHRESLMRKLQIRTVAELTRFALGAGILRS